MSDFEYEYEDGDEWGEDPLKDQEDDNLIEVENMYYEAEDLKNTDPQGAIEMFESVVDIETQAGEEIRWRFKALENIVILSGKLNLEDKMISGQKQLLKFMNKVTRNEASETINNILDNSSKCENTKLSQIIYTMTLQTLKETNEKLWINICLKLGKLYLEKGDFGPLEILIGDLKDTLRKADGTYDEKRGNILDILALEIQMYSEMRQNKKLKKIYAETTTILATIPDPRIMGIIKECGAKMYMNEKNWEMALTEIFEAFKHYQEVGSSRAKTVLKLVAMASMLSNSLINPLESREAKVYKDDPEVIAMVNLRNAYESNEIKQILHIINDKTLHLFDDPSMGSYLGDLLRIIRLKILIEKVKPYKTVKLTFLARELNISENELNELLVELILDEKIEAKIDQITGFLEIKTQHSGIGRMKYQALERLANALVDINSQLMEKIKN